MKTLYNIILFGALAMLCSCSGEIKNLDNGAGVYDEACRIVAYTETPGSKTSVVDGGTTVYWNVEDEIKVFSGEKSAKFISGNTELATSSDFAGPKGFSFAEGKNIVAVYPYSDDVTYDGETITMTLPSEQVACPGTFARGMNISVASSSDSDALQFYNVCGGVRFSVAESGIKKVIFEGLDGEAIAGKVKIDFEDGIPVVREVTDGRLFITLTAPDGASFEVGKWYYIVAIPGALDKGYKLRFYKSDTYAKRLSEQSVTVKRSIFGSLADADEGMEYELIANHFPITESERIKAIEDIEDIASEIKQLVLANKDHPLSSSEFAYQVSKLDGIIDASAEYPDRVVFISKDSLFVNVILNKESHKEEWGASTRLGLGHGNNTNSKIESIIPDGKKALMLLPRELEAYSLYNENGIADIGLYYSIKKSLLAAGYVVDEYLNSDASVEMFRGNNLEKYDVIYFNTHGGYDFHMLYSGEQTTAFMTGTKVLDNKNFSKLFGFLSLCIWADDGIADYWITPKAIDYDNPKFDNTLIFAHACNSSTREDMSSYAIDAGAGCYSGFTDTADKIGSGYLAYDFIRLLSSGMNVKMASNWTKQNTSVPGKDVVVKDAFIFQHSFKEESEDYYIVNPTPTNLQSSVYGNTVSFIWNIPQTAGTYEYRIAVDGELLAKQFGDNYVNRTSATYSTNKSGTHTWYVQADLFVDGEKVASFKSEEKTFTISGSGLDIPATPEAIDLGLSVKWASFNLGASKPEEYGGHYQWGGLQDVTNTSLYLHWSNCPYHTGSDYTTGWTKYIPSYQSSYWSGPGSPDNKTVLDPEDDVAHVKLGGKWRMPTKAEFEELRDNCISERTTLDGVDGRTFTSKKNGNSIFLPFAGYRDRDDIIGINCGDYWSSSLDRSDSPNSSCYAYQFYFHSDFVSSFNNYRWSGLSVRPVYCDIIKATGIMLDMTSLSLSTGAAAQLKATLIPSNCMEKGLVWSSDNPSVATVSGSGLVISKSAGKAVITVSWAGDSSIDAVCTVTVTGPPFVPEKIDLGLPSGLKWASCNLGASKPERYGGYYQWGGLQDVTDMRILLSWNNCPYHSGSEKSTGWTKYVPSNMSSYWSGSGIPDNKTVLDPEDDVAHVMLGGKWRMPTAEEFLELDDQCTSEWITLNGVKGRKFTSKNNGNSIFLPSAGYRYCVDFYEVGSGGCYWSSSLYTDYPYDSYCMFFNSDGVTPYTSLYRCNGHSVRPVSE